MADITWNRVGNPNFSDSNQLRALAAQQLTNVGASLKEAAQGYQDALRKRNHGILQDYINSAKTPEELQSEQFQQGFKNLQATLQNEYDAQAVSQYRDNRGDVLLKRAADQVSLDRNKLGLSTDQLKEATRIGMNNLATLANDPIAYAAEVARLKDLNQFDPSIEQARQLGAAQITQATNANDLYDHQKADLYKAPGLENAARAATTKSTLGMLGIAQAKAPFENALLRAQANEADASAASKKDKSAVPYDKTLGSILDGDIKNFRDYQTESLKQKATRYPWLSVQDYINKEFQKGGSQYQYWGADKNPTGSVQRIMDVAHGTDAYMALSDPEKASVLASTVGKMNSGNVMGKQDWFFYDNEKYQKLLNDSITEHTQYKDAMQTGEGTRIQDMKMKMWRARGGTFEEASNIVNQMLGVSPTASEAPASTSTSDVAEMLKKLKKVSGGVDKTPAPSATSSNAAALSRAVPKDPANAANVQYLQDLIARTKDPIIKKALQVKLDKLIEPKWQ